VLLFQHKQPDKLVFILDLDMSKFVDKQFLYMGEVYKTVMMEMVFSYIEYSKPYILVFHDGISINIH
jgi:hypothetical protein